MKILCQLNKGNVQAHSTSVYTLKNTFFDVFFTFLIRSDSNKSSKNEISNYNETIYNIFPYLEFHKISIYDIPNNELENISKNVKHIKIWFMNIGNDGNKIDNNIDRINEVYMHSNNNIIDNESILSRLRHSCIFKIDKIKQVNRSFIEYEIYKILITNEKTISPYFVMPFARARKYFNHMKNLPSVVTSLLNNNNTNNNNHNNNNDNTENLSLTGLLMERCVGTLSDVIESDKYFNENFDKITDNKILQKFDWQPSKPSDSTSPYVSSKGKNFKNAVREFINLFTFFLFFLLYFVLYCVLVFR